MIVVDTSALIAIVHQEAGAQRCAAELRGADRVLISAGTLSEAMIVGIRRNVCDEIKRLLDKANVEVIPIDAATAARIEHIYRTYGKGFHKAALNFGDCFAYDVAREHNCPLLYVGDDFAHTDIASAL